MRGVASGHRADDNRKSSASAKPPCDLQRLQFSTGGSRDFRLELLLLLLLRIDDVCFAVKPLYGVPSSLKREAPR